MTSGDRQRRLARHRDVQIGIDPMIARTLRVGIERQLLASDGELRLAVRSALMRLWTAT